MMQTDSMSTPFWQHFLRSTGLGAINELTSWIRGRRHRSEEKKIVLSTSRWTALSRCCVHILPTLVSVAIISINVRQLYVGIDFNSLIGSETLNIALLQTAAKIQELLITASLATIIFQLVRDELLYGDGLPLGLLGAGLDFTKLSFFWSSEIFGSVRSLFRGPRKYKKIQLAIFLVCAGALALLAGPSCAVLLVPQQQDWPAGGTSFYLNGTKDEFWPAEIDASPGLSEICSSSNATYYGVCPSGGYRSLWSHYAKLDRSSLLDAVVPQYAKELSGSNYYWRRDSARPVDVRTIALGIGPGDTFVVSPHLSVSLILDQLMQDWWSTLTSTKHFRGENVEDRKAVSSNVFNANVGVRCSPAEVLKATEHTVQFPVGTDLHAPLLSQDLTNSSLSDHAANHLRSTWIPLPDNFESVSTGVVLESPWTSDGQSRLIIGCSIQATWIPAHLHTDAYSFWEGWYPKNVTWDRPYPKKGDTTLNGTLQSKRNAIVVNPSWLRTLTPPTPIEGPGYFDWRPTTIESILLSVGLTNGLDFDSESIVEDWRQDRTDLFTSVLGSVFADGLSRVNIDKMYRTDGDPSDWVLNEYERKQDFNKLLLQGIDAIKKPNLMDSNVNELSVSFSISGLSYRHTTISLLAILVLLLHMVFAILHTAWTVGRSKSSACWDSVTEMIVLAQNSRPAHSALQNTAAGVRHTSTFAKKITIRPTKLPTENDSNHLELLFEEEESHMEREMEAVPVLHPGKSSSATIGPSDDSSSGQAIISHPSTWPSYRRESNAVSTQSFAHINESELSRSSSPLLIVGHSGLMPH